MNDQLFYGIFATTKNQRGQFSYRSLKNSLSPLPMGYDACISAYITKRADIVKRVYFTLKHIKIFNEVYSILVKGLLDFPNILPYDVGATNFHLVVRIFPLFGVVVPGTLNKGRNYRGSYGVRIFGMLDVLVLTDK
jgi:hypothetical protein